MRDFEPTMSDVSDLTLVDRDRCFQLFQAACEIHRTFGGCAAEVGVYRGGTALLMAEVYGASNTYAFDTFSGIPNADPSRDVHASGDFSDVGDAEARLRHAGLHVVKGVFPRSAAGVDDGVRFSLVHVDGDTYATTRDAIEWFWPRILPGGAMVFDDYRWHRCPGVEQALDEFKVRSGVEVAPLARYQAMLVKGERHAIAHRPRVMVCIPMKVDLHPDLKAAAYRNASSLCESNPRLEMATMFDARREPRRPGDDRPCSAIARVRNRMLESLDLGIWDYLLWIDADVVAYPRDLPTRLIQANPGGVTAPMVLVDGTERFYDWAAFVMHGKAEKRPTDRFARDGRQLAHDPPYWPVAPPGSVVAMDCVGSAVCVPTSIYRDGARHGDHPSFSDHYPVCAHARTLRMAVAVDRASVAYHANLPFFGEAWH